MSLTTIRNGVHHHPTNRVARLLDTEAALLSMELVRPPRKSRQIGMLVLALFFISPFALIFVPWQQYVSGSGQVVAYDPTERPQEIDAPIDGRIKQWYVVEGTRVAAGDLIVEIVDNDPQFLKRLNDQLVMEQTRLSAYQERAELLKLRVELQEEARDRAVEAAQNHLEMAQARVLQTKAELTEAEAALERDKFVQSMQTRLVARGLSATQEQVLADRDYKQSLARIVSMNAAIQAAEQEVEARQADLARVLPEQNAAIQAAEGELRAALGDLQAIQRELTNLSTQIDRQETQNVYAPRDGIILRILANQTTNAQVPKGKPLVLLVPDVQDRVAEIYVDGNDAPLIQEGDPVRLQFEGWPAVQFVGWPSVAVGTFGGRVKLVDATSNEFGKFRILVEPDTGSGDEPWPSARWLRQGVRAKGFVLLKQVMLGYEVWRRLNGFPPVISEEEPGTEPIKVKRPK